MKELPKNCERAIVLGEYILENKSTVRTCAKQFGISKSTVHKLFSMVKEVLETNKRERHIRGGQATKLKYEEKNKQKIAT